MTTEAQIAGKVHPRVVACLTGTLPDGGYEDGTPIWTCDAPGLWQATDADVGALHAITRGNKLSFRMENVVSRPEAARINVMYDL